MIHISLAQMNALQEAARGRFASKLFDYFANECPALTHAYDGTPVPKGEALLETITELIRAGQSFRLTTELGLGHFVTAGLGYSRSFYLIPHVKTLLSAPDVSPEQAMQQVINAIIVAEAKRGF